MSTHARADEYRSAVLTTANQLTLLRIIFVPVFIILLVYDQTGWALATFMAAAITDVLDGLIARRFGQKTTVGAFLDPIADKLLMTSSIVILSLPIMAFANPVPRWLMIIMISRDVFIFLFTLVLVMMAGHRTFPPSTYGKASTVLQVVTVFVVLYCNWRGAFVPELQLLYFMTGFMTAFSGLHYLVTKALVLK
jgi:cardiolipin synthase (CMP-forming)